MAGDDPGASGPGDRFPTQATRLGIVICVLVIAGVCVAEASAEHLTWVTAVVAVAAFAAGFSSVRTIGLLAISPSFILVTLCAGLLGPVSAVLVCVPTELITARRLETRGWMTASNLIALAGPALIFGDLVRLVAPDDRHALLFYVVLVGGAGLYLVLNFGAVAVFSRLFHSERILDFRVFAEYIPTQALNVVLAVAGAAIYVRVGLPGMVFALAAVFTFVYMAQLLERAREQARRAEEQAEVAQQRADENLTLSYGVLSGLVHALDLRDHRAARHAVAVAQFAADIAAEAGLSERERELAHTAGLLHDIGQIVAYDRIYESGRELTGEDWERIHGHPEVGEELLRNLGGYGPVAEIVRSHHERVDGWGYPDNLVGEDIPVLSRIIAVAEAYDTITSPDTYRPITLSPLQALNELRKHAGKQFDGTFVDALSRALGTRAFDDHVVRTADFDAELGLERRIREARRRPDAQPPAATG